MSVNIDLMEHHIEQAIESGELKLGRLPTHRVVELIKDLLRNLEEMAGDLDDEEIVDEVNK